MTAWWRVLGRLRLSDWPAVSEIALRAACVEVGLRLLPLPRLASLLGVPLIDSREMAREAFSPNLPLPRRALHRMVIAHGVMRRWPYGDTCLRVALVDGSLLRRFGPRLVIGVATVEGRVKAHAWLTIDGISLDPSLSGAFAAMTPAGS